MQSAASKQAELEILITDALEAKRSEARTKLEEMKARLHGTEEYTAADPDKKAAADAEFECRPGNGPADRHSADRHSIEQFRQSDIPADHLRPRPNLWRHIQGRRDRHQKRLFCAKKDNQAKRVGC